jgi:hypothetical protein
MVFRYVAEESDLFGGQEVERAASSRMLITYPAGAREPKGDQGKRRGGAGVAVGKRDAQAIGESTLGKWRKELAAKAWAWARKTVQSSNARKPGEVAKEHTQQEEAWWDATRPGEARTHTQERSGIKRFGAAVGKVNTVGIGSEQASGMARRGPGLRAASSLHWAAAQTVG